jgi:uncharacterized protein YecE (DUF72 family)
MRGYLDWLLGVFAGYPIAVELRHRSWSDAADDTRAQLASHGAAWTLVDEPKFASSVRQAPIEEIETSEGQHSAADENSALTYIRLHGRNAAMWWEHDEAEDRYDYLYSAAELQPIAQVARRAAASKRVLVYFNNHFSAKAVANAAVLRHELDQRPPGEYEREMIDRYPELEGIVTRSGLPY